jgi:hypothetical protein
MRNNKDAQQQRCATTKMRKKKMRKYKKGHMYESGSALVSLQKYIAEQIS